MRSTHTRARLGALLPRPLLTALGVLALGACDTSGQTTPPDEGGEVQASDPAAAPEPITADTKVTVLEAATVMTAAGTTYSPGAVVIVGERIHWVGEPGAVELPSEVPADEIERRELGDVVITPGIIDTHSHMGVYASPGLRAHSDGNEAVNPVTPYVRAEDGFWVQDPQLNHALAGGVTSAQILPGSANLIGGRSFTIKLRPGARSAEDLRFEGAPAGLKMACGENPKRVYGDKGGPSTRMGNHAGYRKAFEEAVEYQRKWDAYERKLALWETEEARTRRRLGSESEGEAAAAKEKERPEPPSRDFGLETLAGVIEGDILLHMHCYRADEMSIMMEFAAGYGFSVRSFHHAVEAYKIADRLADNGTSVSIWADWWGFKAEAYDGIRENAALVTKAGARAVIHSDSPTGIQRLNQEAAKAMFAGRRAGVEISEEQALAWLTTNPAWTLGIEDQTGSLEAGKDADIVVWNRSPFSVYAQAQLVFIDGELVYERAAERPRTDFDLGLRDDLRGAP